MKSSHFDQEALVGIQIPKRLTRIFIDYLTDAQLTRLSFWITHQSEREVSAMRTEQIQQEMEKRALQLPASWQELPFDDEAQKIEWKLWAQLQHKQQQQQ